MTPRYTILPAADQDLDEQAAYLNESVGLELALRFYDAAAETFAFLARTPGVGATDQFGHRNGLGERLKILADVALDLVAVGQKDDGRRVRRTRRGCRRRLGVGVGRGSVGHGSEPFEGELVEAFGGDEVRFQDRLLEVAAMRLGESTGLLDLVLRQHAVLDQDGRQDRVLGRDRSRRRGLGVVRFHGSEPFHDPDRPARAYATTPQRLESALFPNLTTRTRRTCDDPPVLPAPDVMAGLLPVCWQFLSFVIDSV